MAATPSLNPKSVSYFFTIPQSIPSTEITHLAFSTNPAKQSKKFVSVLPNAKKKNPWLDPFDQGDDPHKSFDVELFIHILWSNENNRYYDMILSTKLAGIGHAALLFMSPARDRVSYVYPSVNAVGAGLMLSETFRPDRINLSEGGYNMYHEMIDWLGRPARNVPRQPLPPLQVSISRKLNEVVDAKDKNVGVQMGKYIVIHGIQSDSKASMQSRGDTDSLLPLEIWNEITSGITCTCPNT